MDHFSSKNAKIREKHISSFFDKMMKHQLPGLPDTIINPVICSP